MLNKKGLPEIITFAISFLILFAFYHEVLMHPNDYLFSAWGDGVKNYYSYMYHAEYDSGFWDFSGMNYPYYEHMVYTDGHPLLSYLIGLFGLTAYGVGILNLLMLLSYPVCSVILYKILNHYKVEKWWSILAAVSITFLSPQIFRLTGHFSLSYVFAVPGMWYILIKASQSNKLKWLFIGFTYLLVFFFTHPYLGMILVTFGAAFWIVRSVILKQWKWNLIKFLIIGIAPVVIFQLLVFLTDTHLDRTGQPQGFYDYYAKWSSVLVPHHGPVFFISDKIHFKIPHWETMAYVGFGTIIFFLIILTYTIKNRSSIPFKKYLKNELTVFVIAAWLVLVFSFCFPLRFSFMHWLADSISPLKQFRVLGRFTWVFFYVATVGSVVLYYRFQLQNKKKIWTALFVFLMLLQLSEGLFAHKEVSGYVSQAPNSFKKETLSPKLQELISFVDESDYDAFMILPFQHMSSENIMLLGTEGSNFDSFMLSYHCSKPTLNCSSSRMSISEAIKFNNFFSPEYIEKELINDFPKDDKILIIKRKEACTEGEMRLLFTSKEVFNNDEYVALEFQPEKYNSDYYFNQIVEKEKTAVYDVGEGFKSDTTDVWFFYKSWDDDKGESLGGEGAWHSQKEKLNPLHEFFKEDGLEEGSYTVSFWYYLGVDAPTMAGIIDQDFGGEEESIWASTFDVKLSTLIVDKWCRVNLNFEWTDNTDKVLIYLQGSGNHTPFYVDELLVYKTDGPPLFRREKRKGIEYIIYNNEWIKADSFSK
ncbi:YfhO family protein [Paracrocinitomix mangrovi]|uniref:YfhO family protein n=1 Tax=Paracrocinitomix mangrovi TaxID=2862509 RepID=UPI001C8EC74A|nr:YfhO family protein [Paracrocinitomix mangrovi]UKN00609.1 YfhO family protein [Paracrocinitomix mangrovi]